MSDTAFPQHPAVAVAPRAPARDGGRPALTAPKVTIGVPVFNAEKYLGESLASLLDQTFDNFELIISDNASTDRTAEICAEVAAIDRRVQVIRQPRNVGAVRNWDAVLQAARGQYFKWSSANDRVSPQLLERCVEVLDRDPQIVACYGATALIDDDGDPLGDYPHDLMLMDPRPSQRFARVCMEMRLNNAQCSVIRTAELRRAGRLRLFPGGDIGLMAELSLYGKFYKLPDTLLFRRMARDSSTRFLSDTGLLKFLDPQELKSRPPVAWHTHWDYLKSVVTAPIPPAEKIATLKYIARSCWWERERLWQEAGDWLRRKRQP